MNRDATIAAKPKVNEENLNYYLKENKKHLNEGGKMPVACGLTNLVCKRIEEKDYKFLTPKNGEDMLLWDVIARKTMANDVIFGVLTERDSNVLIIKTGTAQGIITKHIEG